MVSQGDKIVAILCHLCVFFGFVFLLPLIVWLLKKDESPWLADQSREALNFHISLLIYGAICVVLCFVFIGFFLAGVLTLFAAVCAIIAAIRAAEGKLFVYPFTIRLIK